jgi:hypothetical protein
MTTEGRVYICLDELCKMFYFQYGIYICATDFSLILSGELRVVHRHCYECADL